MYANKSENPRWNGQISFHKIQVTEIYENDRILTKKEIKPEKTIVETKLITCKFPTKPWLRWIP